MAAIPDRTRDSTKSLSILIVDAEEKPAEADNKNEEDAATIVHPKDSVVQAGSFGSGGDHCVYPTNVYAPQAQPFYYRGYDGGSGEWAEYPPYVNAEGLEIGSPGVYNDNRSVLFHSGYGYNPQMPYGPYSPVTTPLPPVGGDAQLYSPQQFSFSGPPYYQQLVAPSMPYVTSPTPVSKPELTSVVSIDQQGDSMIFGQRPVFPPVGSFSRGGFPGGLGFHDSQQGIEGIRSGGIWSDWSKPSDRQRSLMPFSPAVSPQPTGPLGSFGQNVRMASYQQKSFYGFGSGPNSYNSGYLPSGLNQGSNFGGASISSLRANGRNWLSLENSRRYLKGSGSLCSCNGTPDILSEQNRGPRALKPKSQITAENLSLDNSERSTATPKIHDDLHNRPDFVTEYKEAKFFVIKSYSEDNVHKSIKYGVWASTANGNRKLDAAYREALEKQQICPVFLFFSVNASAQFCGVAEMVGSVDFDKSVDYWQQDKWSGQFPVKWHMIKDVPNSQFRHIVLENNDNKPVTNSRDTQEVKLEQGIEMLNIFKNHETDMSILDDFDFYEERQKAMEERKARQQAGVLAVGVAGEHGHRNAVTLPGDFIKQMSKSFAQVVRMDEGGKEVTLAERPSSTADGSIGIKLEDSLTIAVSSAHTS